MLKKKNKSSRIYEFWYLFLLTIGICIGSGIYVKNQELLNQTKSPWLVVGLWLVVGFICVISIVAFMEIAQSTKKEGNGTIANWCKHVVGRRFGSLISIMYTFIYVPAYQSIFLCMAIAAILDIFGVSLRNTATLAFYLWMGLGLTICSIILNVYFPKTSRNFHLYSLFFRFIPLVIVFFAGFILLAIGNTGSNQGMKPQGDIVALNLFGGVGAVFFSFDGYIFTANQQKAAKHKEVVPIAIIFGLIFITLFYVLMAFSLFLSGDGTVNYILVKVLSGGADQGSFANKFGLVVTAIIIASIGLFNVNMFCSFGITEILSSNNAKLLYLPKEKTTYKTAALYQAIITGIFYAALVTLGVLIKGNPIVYIGSMASTSVISLFAVLSILILFAMINRKTNKFEVEKIRGFWPTSIISFIMLNVFNIAGLLSFIMPNLLDADKPSWSSTDGPVFTAIFITAIAIVLIIWGIQEYIFTKKPFANGFEGEKNLNLIPNNWSAAKIAK